MNAPWRTFLTFMHTFKGWWVPRWEVRKSPGWPPSCRHIRVALAMVAGAQIRGTGQERTGAFLHTWKHQSPWPLMQLEKMKSLVKKTFFRLYNFVISGQRSSCWLFLQILVKNNTGPKKVTTIDMALLRSGSFSLLGWNNLISRNGSSNCY